jgi:ABC-type proline/glycine betaine transport system ATPase subunit
MGIPLVLVSNSSAGKSTLVNLLCRLYDSTKGRLLINGHDVEEYDPVELRKQIAVLFQDKGRALRIWLICSVFERFLYPRECRNRSC